MTLRYWDHNIASILKACGIGVAPLARHHALEEAPAIVKLATKDVDQVVNGTPALSHQLLKFFEGYFSHCPPLSVKNIWEGWNISKNLLF
jgi:hypothetical protein